tara:strand:- start:1477 stop:2310 length:834 start_codon:yes stop_codon:yes gene_type:complete
MKINTIIKPKSGFQLIDLQELFYYKDLLIFMVKREVTVIYKQTILGFSWAIIKPLFSMVIFSIIFGGLAEIPSDDIPYPLFSYVALVPWTYFSTSMTRSTQSLVASAGIISKVYFPRLIIPLTPVLSGLIDFIISFSVIGILMIYFSIVPTLNILYLPILILMMVLTSAGIGMWLSALAIQYRDINFIVQFLAQILMYAAPVVWPVSLLESKFSISIRIFYGLYPMAGVIEGFRASLLGSTDMPWDLIGMGLISTFLIFISGAIYFKRKEPIFTDVI